MEFRQLRTFLAVVAEGTVTDAAVALGLAPSSVSEQIRSLERSLDTSLFERTPDGMRPTSGGERMISWARRLLDQADRARAEVTGRPAALRLGALETLAATRIPAVLARLAAHRPETAVEVVALYRAEMLSRLVAGDLDAALLLDAGDELGALGFPSPAAPLAFADLEEVPLAYVTAPGASMDRLLVTPPGCSFRMVADRVFGTDGARTEVGSVWLARSWAAQGLGAALLPEFALGDDLAEGRLVRHPLDVPPVVLRLVWPADREPELRDLLYAAASPT